MSSNLRYPIQLNSRRQISYTASDNRTPDQSGAFAANQSADMDEKRMSSILLDIPGPNLAAKTTKTKREDPKSKFKKNPTGLRLAIPTELDVLAGRGGETNKHVGNVVFREEARNLRAWYRLEGTSRDEKCELSMVKMLFVNLLFSSRQILNFPPHRDVFVSQDLVKRINKNGGRFLGKCGEGLWFVMNDKDARKKATQGKIWYQPDV